MSESIFFFNEDCNYTLRAKTKIRSWLNKIATKEKHKIASLNYVFCSDAHLLEINKEYLQHDFYTDIISFPLGTNPIEGDIFVSIDRIRENAKTNNQKLQDELLRVLSHGLFHFLGYKDKTKAQQLEMRQKEDSAIRLFYKSFN